MQSARGCPRCQHGDRRTPAGLPLLRYLSPGGDRAGNARQMAPCTGAGGSEASAVLLRKLIGKESACMYWQ